MVQITLIDLYDIIPKCRPYLVFTDQVESTTCTCIICHEIAVVVLIHVDANFGSGSKNLSSGKNKNKRENIIQCCSRSYRFCNKCVTHIVLLNL